MSWDIFVQDLPANARFVGDIPDNFVPRPLGQKSDIIRKIQEVVPFADFSNPSLGVIATPNFIVDVSIGDDEIVKSVLLNVWGGDTAVAVIADILRHLQLRALDANSETGFFEPDTSQESFRKWRAYRDHVVSG